MNKISIRKNKKISPSKNQISWSANTLLNIWFGIWTLLCVLPLLLVVIVSFSSEQSIFEKGYSFLPLEWSTSAYEFFFKLGDQLVRSYGITIFVTIVGTLFSLAISATFAYVLSRSDYAYNRLFTLLMLFTMLFNGGIVATYMVNSRLLGLGNSIGALIFPMSFNAFYIVVLRTFYKSIPIQPSQCRFRCQTSGRRFSKVSLTSRPRSLPASVRRLRDAGEGPMPILSSLVVSTLRRFRGSWKTVLAPVSTIARRSSSSLPSREDITGAMRA